jgi:UDP:flavonoid glycosyltransferase YjiC (YdhE family)
MAWELGGNLGHVAPLLTVARALRGRGHKVVFALRDLSNADLIARSGFAFLAAPEVRRKRPPLTYGSFAEMLAGEAFPSAKAAFVGALAWRSIFRAVRPDVLLADHAPTALLAARGQGMRTVLCGVPFSIPPAGRPLPRFSKQARGAAEREAKLLARLNGVLAVLRGPALETASALYGADAVAVKWLPELDFFGPRPRSHYAGPVLSDAGDAEPAWPNTGGPKLLVYLRPGSHLPGLLEAMKRSDASVVGYIPGDTSLNLSETPLKMSALLPQCDALVCHGGNLSAAAVLHGKPLLLYPVYVEQRRTAERAREVGVAAVAGTKTAPDLDALRPDGELARAAAKIARRQDAGLRNAVEAVVERIEGAVERAEA